SQEMFFRYSLMCRLSIQADTETFEIQEVDGVEEGLELQKMVTSVTCHPSTQALLSGLQFCFIKSLRFGRKLGYCSIKYYLINRGK
ncbi:mCG145336, partial [Mus musculus]